MIDIVHYQDTNSVEVTWFSADGKPIRCHSYGQTQMDMLASDLGENAGSYAELISMVKANQIQQAGVPMSYAQRCAAEYPPMAEYLDAIVKGDAAQQQAYISACLAVKAKYPKL